MHSKRGGEGDIHGISISSLTRIPLPKRRDKQNEKKAAMPESSEENRGCSSHDRRLPVFLRKCGINKNGGPRLYQGNQTQRRGITPEKKQHIYPESSHRPRLVARDWCLKSNVAYYVDVTAISMPTSVHIIEHSTFNIPW